MQVVSGSQFSFDLQPTIRQRFRTLRECVHWTVLNDPRGPQAVAGDCDISVSELSRRLAPSEGDPRSCDVNLMVRVMHSTRDLSPLHWLMAEFLQDQDTKQRAAIDQILTMGQQMVALAAAAGLQSKPARR